MPNTEWNGDAVRPRHVSRKAKMGLAAAGILVLGGIGGAAVVAQTRPSVTMAPVTPVAIRSLSSGGIVTIRGRVAEVYGNKFIMADGSGRALVDAGRRGEDGALVTAGEPVLVQGRFDHGFVHAAFLVGPDKNVVALGPLDGPHHGPGGRHGPDRGPDHGPGMPPPGADDGPDAPAPGADRAVPPPPPMAPATGVPAGAATATAGTTGTR